MLSFQTNLHIGPNTSTARRCHQQCFFYRQQRRFFHQHGELYFSPPLRAFSAVPRSARSNRHQFRKPRRNYQHGNATKRQYYKRGIKRDLLSPGIRCTCQRREDPIVNVEQAEDADRLPTKKLTGPRTFTRFSTTGRLFGEQTVASGKGSDSQRLS